MTMRRLCALVLFLLPALFAGQAANAETLSVADLIVYRAAFKAVDQDHWLEARRLAGLAKNPLPGKVIQWLDLTRPGPGRSFDEITQFLAQNPDWPDRNKLQAMAEHNMPADMSADAVLAWFKDRPPSSAYGAAALAQALMAKGRSDAATDMIREAWRDDNFDNDADELGFLAVFQSGLQPEDHIARLDRLLWNHDEDGARQVMPLVDPGHRALAEARLALAKQEPTAAALVAAVPPALQRDAGLLYERATAMRRADDYLGEAAVLDPPPADIGRPDLFWPELEDAARRAVVRGDMSVAFRLAAGHGATEGSVFAEGEWLAGWIGLRFLDDYKESYDRFTGLYAGVTSPISKARGAYWAGRASEEMGDLATAQNWYRAAASNLTTYYGQLAAARLGSRDVLRFGPMPEPSAAERAEFDKRELVRVVRLLGELGQSDRTRGFLKKMADDTQRPTTLRMIADLGREQKRDDLAIMVAKIARTKGVDLIDYLYPMREIPVGAGPEQALVLAVIRQESAFEVKATSTAGALGLMQLMPQTAKHVAKGLKTRYKRDFLTKDPDYNIRLGRSYLQELLDNYGQSYVLAIAAYNAGPDRVDSWIAQFGDPRDYGTDVVDWIESIPFAETRNYVQRVLENLQVYRHRLGIVQIAQSLQQDLTRRGSP